MHTGESEPNTDRTRLMAAAESAPPVAGRPPRLLIVSGIMLGHQIEVLDAPVTIGRATECTLSLPYPAVSRTHCRIVQVDGQVFIEDLGSTNKTYVNGQPITGKVLLNDGDQIGVGNSALKFFTGTSTEARYHQELINLATFDSLTGLYNRRHFMTLLEEECGRARREPVALSLIMLDIDFFKKVNDEMGHVAGDQALKLVSKVLGELAKPMMAVGRLGGEEFAVLCRNTSLADAAAHAEVLRQAIASREFRYEGTLRPLSSSFGVATWQASFEATTDLVKAADEQLYRAKGSGRNRVCIPA
jgi:diguanylate cyclase (GGDEF)-like protein